MKIRKMLTIALLAAFAFDAGASASRKPEDIPLEELKAVSESREWRLLMHYRRAFPLMNLRSEVDGEEFFFAKRGKTEPLEELKASLDVFFHHGTDPNRTIGNLKQTPLCAFPARSEFIARRLGVQFKKADCEKLSEFMRRFNADSATLVFSSAYPNNPGSMFGHTFLRINSKAGGEGNPKKDLLDYGLSYAAMVSEDENPFLFVAFGLTGGYRGQFSMLPYYMKVNEYNNGESRDLWEYDLALTPEETERMLKHAWELETTSFFRYFFFDENCAYELLTLLEVAKPEWEISQFPIYVIPAETIKRLTAVPGAVTGVRYRPSLRKKMLARFDRLEASEKKEALKAAQGERDFKTIGDARVLDATTSYLFYRQKEKNGPPSEEEKALLLGALKRRSDLPSGSEEEEAIPVDEFSRPDRGHFPFQLGLSGGRSEKSEGTNVQEYADLRFKFAYHDLLNSDVGYIPFSHIDFPGMVLRRDLKRKKVFIEEMGFLAITSLFPLQSMEKRASWKFSLSSRSPIDRNCFQCKVFHGDVGAGVSILPAGRSWIVYAMASPTLEFADFFNRMRFIPAVELATIWNPFEPFKIQGKVRRHFDLFQNDRQRFYTVFEGNASYAFSRSLETRLVSRWVLPSSEEKLENRDLALQVNFYFQ